MKLAWLDEMPTRALMRCPQESRRDAHKSPDEMPTGVLGEMFTKAHGEMPTRVLSKMPMRMRSTIFPS